MKIVVYSSVAAGCALLFIIAILTTKIRKYWVFFDNDDEDFEHIPLNPSPGPRAKKEPQVSF